MIHMVFTFLKRLPGIVGNYSVGLFYSQWTHRYLLYLALTLLIGIWAYVALEIYGRLTWRVTTISFRGSHVVQTMMNFGICFYIVDEWLARLTGRWGRFENRTLGKQALVWGVSFIIAFSIQRTIVFEGMQYYAMDIYFYYQQYPQMRPHVLDHFLFCLPFFIITILALWFIAFLRQHGLEKESDALENQKKALLAKEEKIQNLELPNKDSDSLSSIYIQSGSSQIVLTQKNISHITVEDHYCRIYLANEGEEKSYFIKSSLTDLMKNLHNNHFVQIHRSHVVNISEIRLLDKKNRTTRVHLQSGAVLPVSRYRLKEVKNSIKNMLDQESA